MFGYIRIFKPHLRMCEYDTYKSIYCGLCKELGKSYGIISRFTLSYDFTFLAMLDLAINEKNISLKKERCIAHPLKKTVCVQCTDDLFFTASAAVISIYHKLMDDRQDKGLKKKLIATLLIPFVRKHYKKASKAYPEVAVAVENEMKQQSLLEKEKCSSIDRAGEPTANIMRAIISGISSDPQTKRVLERLGYLLGRFVYYCDAIEDLNEDYKKNNYNALLLQKEFGVLDKETRQELIEITTDTINMTLGEIANTYVLLKIEKYKSIIDNIIYLGLKNTYAQILKGEFEKEKKENE